MRIGLFGVPGFNRGDDAICLSVAEWVRDRFPLAHLTVATLAPLTVHPTGSVEEFIVDRRSLGGLWRLANAIRTQDVLLLGGGSLIQDKFGGGRLKGTLGYAWFVTLLAQIFSVPVISVGLGVDELTTEAGRRAAGEVISRLSWISVRDKISTANLKAIAKPRREPVTIPDPAFSLSSRDDVTVAGDYFVLSPAFEGVDENRIAKLFANIAAEMLGKFPASTIQLISMDHRDEQDGGKLSLITNLLPPKHLARVEFQTPVNAYEAAGILRNSMGVVAMRLHSIILAFGYAPVFCISRTTKTQALMVEYDIAGIDLDQPHFDVPEKAIAALLHKRNFATQRSRQIQLRGDASQARNILNDEIKKLLEVRG